MPKNRLIYYGVLFIAASALLWLGAELARLVAWILPYTGGFGVLLIILGIALELRKKPVPTEKNEGA
jgi:hypothetical protein